ncbi:MAG: DUF3592 domain-containing protein [Chthonomonadaceae bacterium]|nr:DUF3592 domain-containing protein [Chthonomonadaceae bacterium]
MAEFVSRVSEKLFLRFFQWLLFATFVGVGFGWLAGGKELSLANRLATEGVRVQGAVTETSAGDYLNAPTVRYRYVVNGETLYGYSHTDPEKVVTYAPGDSVEVTYLPSDPGESGTDLVAMQNSGNAGLFRTVLIEAVVALFFWGPVVFSKLAIGKLNFPVGNFLVGMVITGLMFLVGVGVLFGSAVPQLKRAEALADHAEVVDAQITGVYDGEHGRYADYAYTVGGKHYSGEAPYGGGYGDRGTLRIRYLPSEPGYSSMSPFDELSNAKQGVAFMSVWTLLALGFTVAIYIAGRRTL